MSATHDAYRQGHLDACKDDRCVLLPDSSYPSFRDGVKAGEDRVRQEVTLLIDRVRDLAWKATQYGATEDGDTAAYLIPKGVLHRLVGEAQAHGFTTVTLRDATQENADDGIACDWCGRAIRLDGGVWIAVKGLSAVTTRCAVTPTTKTGRMSPQVVRTPTEVPMAEREPGGRTDEFSEHDRPSFSGGVPSTGDLGSGVTAPAAGVALAGALRGSKQPIAHPEPEGLPCLVGGGGTQSVFVVRESGRDHLRAGVVGLRASGAGVHGARIACTKTLDQRDLREYVKSMTSSQERVFRLNGIAAMIEAGRFADAYDRAVEITPLGRTQRWLLAIGSLRIGLYDAAWGQSVNLDDLLTAAKRAAR